MVLAAAQKPAMDGDRPIASVIRIAASGTKNIKDFKPSPGSSCTRSCFGSGFRPSRPASCPTETKRLP